jgi:hypothetical protein
LRSPPKMQECCDVLNVSFRGGIGFGKRHWEE